MTQSLIVIFEEGVAARERDLSREENPHPWGTDEHQVWAEGWHRQDAEADNSEWAE